MGRFINLSGQKFGRLTAIERAENRGTKTMWLCECDCGNRKIIAAGDLGSGRTNSCGCLRKEYVAAKNYIHGHTDDRLNSIWRDMKKRCYNPRNKSYKDYGARGIELCNEWRNDFMSFYKWAIANGYSDELSIDRIDNDKGYEPSNCRWATRLTQNINQRIRKDNKTGVRGVRWDKNLGKYEAFISIKGVRFGLGFFEGLDEATKVRRDAEKQYHFNNESTESLVICLGEMSDTG
ncbi:AP2 domain-containing protein [Desulfitobacterium dehalogenans ATCC 51507]|uniref:AP2 domain-containing protein n=1 Tax=Desulfitobacterium dehalogenans (strain ATCC 51507 / DSM 9161 / JW/IU-DC1) TaxID=756499 RepID=I4A6C6_DESDJ|nr:AP2 domain-containing protein [Desulfitobacterium dehalogenans]AFL99510.1 AP2 domain-containing protein [Desulfitobacterium dehalogenans ATCC 51507]